MYTIQPIKNLQATVTVPPDKSISHRAMILSALAKGKTVIKPFLHCEDTLATLTCLRELGVGVQLTADTLIVHGYGMILPAVAPVTITANESGTTMRILSGVLAAQRAVIVFESAPSLAKRPMDRVVLPLREMGADIKGAEADGNIFSPLRITPVECLSARNFNLNIASAQVKSAILLAGLYADDWVSVTEPFISRDHTERMLKLFKTTISVNGKTIKVKPVKNLVSPKKIFIPADFSSAAFFMVLGVILKKSKIIMRTINVNPTRTGLLTVLQRMGADIAVSRIVDGYEPYADIIVKSSNLIGAVVQAGEIPLLIDEVPILCVAAAFAQGETVINGIAELRIKETDRVNSMVKNLSCAGVDIVDHGDRIIIRGGGEFKPVLFNSFGDHRTAMSMIVFGMALNAPSAIDDTACIAKSFPEFTNAVSQFQ